MNIINNKKVLYFADIMFSYGIESLEEEFESLPKRQLAEEGLEFAKVDYWERPPFEEVFDILFFDWGGMSMGNSLMESFCREIIKLAELYPSRYFVMTSTFTAQAMNDAQSYLGEDAKIHNIFLNIYDFAKYYKKHELKIK